MLVLHGHIPEVVGHGTWPHGANWLYEAAAETYLPFLSHLTSLILEGVRVRVTIGFTPVLAEQLQDPRFAPGFKRYVAQRARAAAQDFKKFDAEGDRASAELADRWRLYYRHIREQFEALPGNDIIAAYRALSDAGYVEPIASAATHGFLPLLPTDHAIERQLDIGLAAHERHFGKPARGIWFPECAYRPAGEWTSPADGRTEIREGLEESLAGRDVGFFFVETHLVKRGESRPAYGGTAQSEAEGSPYRVNGVAAKSGRLLSVLARDPLSSEQVWSGVVGYPGDGRYLEFHKRKAYSGHRYWRVTHSKVELHEKLPYEPAEVPSAIASHAAHFVSMVEDVPPNPDGSAPVVVGMFDFELFGHWWFEGPAFLAEVFRRLDGSARARAVTASEAIAETPPTHSIAMPAGTWGRNGTFEVWWNEHTTAYWRKVEEVEARLSALEPRAGKVPKELLAALERQALLLQSSDWPFLIDNEVSRDYAEKRIRGHYEDFTRLAEMAERGWIDKGTFEDIAQRDRLFAPELGA